LRLGAVVVAAPRFAHLEAVRVVVLPTHHGLNQVVQAGKGMIVDLDPAVDRRIDAVERDPQLVDPRSGRLGIHFGGTLARFPFAHDMLLRG
jgi:hypothetical protein